jgi:hypothetical protein
MASILALGRGSDATDDGATTLEGHRVEVHRDEFETSSANPRHR